MPCLPDDHQLLTVSTPRVLVDEIRETARAQHTTMSELVRRAIRAQLDTADEHKQVA